MKRVKEILKKLLKPVWVELPMVVILMILLSPDTFRTIISMIYSAWRGVFYIRVFIRLIHFAGLAFLWAYLLTLIAHYSDKHKNKVKTIIYVIAIISFAIVQFIRYNFLISNITPQVLRLIAETNLGEASGFFSTFIFSPASLKTFAQIALIVAIIILVERYYPRMREKIKLPKLVKIAGGGVLLAIIAFSIHSTSYIHDVYSCTTLEQLEHSPRLGVGTDGMDGVTALIYSSHALNLASDKVSSSREITVKEARHGYATLVAEDSTLNVVLIIGESYIKHHASIYGYELETTPLMMQEQERGNLVVFNDVVAPYNTTAPTLKNMLSCNTGDTQWWEAPLLMAPLKHAGYEVFSWDNQVRQQVWMLGIFTFSIEYFLYNKDVSNACYTATNERSFKYDGDLVSDFNNKVVKTGGLGKFNFVIFHLMGQHFELADRYPESFTHFTADSVQRNEGYITPRARRAIAKYDNATRYNDSVVVSIINMVRSTNSVVIYLSDHGEEVFDYRDSQGRTNIDERNNSLIKDPMLVKYQNQVPFVIWMSDSFKSAHPDFFNQVRQAANVPFMNTDVSQIILYLAQVKTKYYNPLNNPISPSYKPGKRVIYDNVDYDELMRNFK